MTIKIKINFYWVSFILLLIFRLICSGKNSEFIYKHVVRTRALTQTWKTSFHLFPTPNFAFKFLPRTQQFLNPKHPEMGWEINFTEYCLQGEPSMTGSYIHIDLSHRSQQKVIPFITQGQAKQTYSDISLCLCGAFYHFSQFFLLSICLLREFYAPIDQSEVRARLRAICPLKLCAQTQSWRALATAPLQLQSLILQLAPACVS